ncbi:MAG: hypothetical protein LBS62_14945 [Clostridiales bacterium]|jgi:hypothetical protein|nr:hypothetical protein [Clostridiales bacterium]
MRLEDANVKMGIEIYADRKWQEMGCGVGCGADLNQCCEDDIRVSINVEKSNEKDDTEEWRVVASVFPTPGKSPALSGIRCVFNAPSEYKCTFMPHLCPREDMVISEKVFRGAPIILESTERCLVLLPDLGQAAKPHPVPFLMDYRLEGNTLSYGVGFSSESGHVYYAMTGESALLTPLEISFYVVSLKKRPGSWRDYRAVNDYIWRKFAEKTMATGPLPDIGSLPQYVSYAYDWAFRRWKEICWQEFDYRRERIGGVVFIVTAEQKPGRGAENIWREPKSIWNQAWFCSLRSAYGYYKWGERTGDRDLTSKARTALRFALAAPMEDGLFHGYYRADENGDCARGQWFKCSPRRPEGHEEFYHLTDSSWTCYWLMKWYTEIETDSKEPYEQGQHKIPFSQSENSEEILNFVEKYARKLISLQQEDGSFPAWVRPAPGGNELSPFLRVSPESGMHILFLCKLYETVKRQEYLEACEAAADFVTREIIPTGRWEDFETYWSCSPQWEGKRFGVPDARSGLYNQCSLGMYWCAEGLLALYDATGGRQYLDAGEKVLAEMSLYQQIYQPSFFPVDTIGGFGVMTSDNEWNDSRQSLFALTYLRFFLRTGRRPYLARAHWAMRASFYMMYCPENPVVKQLYEQAYPFFDEQDYGFHMENFNHHGSAEDKAVGGFTIFDWANGGAAAALFEFAALLANVNM